jgi:cell division septation protein DedD
MVVSGYGVEAQLRAPQMNKLLGPQRGALAKIPLAVTTDYSQLLPEKNFTEPNARRTAPYWLALGLVALGASGYAAFRAGGTSSKADDTQDAWLLAPVATPGADELQAASDAVFLEDAESANDPSAVGQEVALGAIEATAEADTGATPEPPATPAAKLEDAEAPDPGPAVAAATTATVGAYYLQVASYRTKERADEHARMLTERGLATQSVAYGGPEAGWWHAVRMGPFKQRIEAEQRRFDLQPHERGSAYVLPRSNGKYHVQVASFAEREEAEQVVKRFKAEGHPTKITRVRMSGSYWHCVRIGPFDNREEATAYKVLVPDIPGTQSTVIPFGPPKPLAQQSDDKQD